MFGVIRRYSGAIPAFSLKPSDARAALPDLHRSPAFEPSMQERKGGKKRDLMIERRLSFGAPHFSKFLQISPDLVDPFDR